MISLLLVLGQLAIASGNLDINSVIEENIAQENQIQSELDRKLKPIKTPRKRPNFHSTAKEVLGNPPPETIVSRSSSLAKSKKVKNRKAALKADKRNLERISNEFR